MCAGKRRLSGEREGKDERWEEREGAQRKRQQLEQRRRDRVEGNGGQEHGRG